MRRTVIATAACGLALGLAAAGPAHAARGRIQEILDAWYRHELIVRMPAPRTVASCATVKLDPAIHGPVESAHWRVVSGPAPGVAVDARRAFGRASFRAPAVGAPTDLVLELTATNRYGGVETATTTVTVEPAPVAAGLVPGAFLDCGPFEYGVASGDPLPEAVLLWTRVTPEPEVTHVSVAWEVATDPGFARVVANGTATTEASRDWTVVAEATGLRPATTYYYRFRAPDGRRSALGRTRTAPRGETSLLRFAVASCSSLFSGWFNAYARIAERDDLDLVIHLGDYLYDFVDEQEQVRIPEPFPIEPANLDEWRGRHKDYLADPDLRAARAAHPWAMIWDNHDVERNARPGFNGSVQAFREWSPIRVSDPARPEIIYRTLRYGDLVDLVLIDILLHREIDPVPGTTETSILGDEQFAWLEEQLAASSAAWRVLGNQKPFATIRIDPNLARFIVGERSEVFDKGTWDGFPASRTRLLDFFAALGEGDNVMLSGDSHISIGADLVDFPKVPYDPATGAGSWGVEFMPASISRGNFDETLLEFFGVEAIPDIIEFLITDTVARNPHNVYAEITSHGWGILEVTPERSTAEWWYADILAPTTDHVLGAALEVERDAHRYTRP